MMSSPLGGFYIGARNRMHKARHEFDNRVMLNVSLALAFCGELVFEQEIAIAADEIQSFENASLKLSLSVTIVSSGLYRLNCQIIGLGEFGDKGFDGEQQLNLEANEQLTSLVGGNEQVKLSAKVVPNVTTQKS